jgi:dipeptidase E
MLTMQVLALSSSRVGIGGYLETAAPIINSFLGDKTFRVAFIPFAAPDGDYDNYLNKVREGLSALPHSIDVVRPGNAKSLIKQAEVIMVGGGNTFKLLHDIYAFDLIDLISEKVHNEVPYIGWSAGANIAGLTIGTTNDMPIIEPKSFKAFGFLPFQINPHYISIKQEGHNGETRDERLHEYLKVNPHASIIGLPEGTALQREGKSLKLLGTASAMLFRLKEENREPSQNPINPGSDLSWLLEQKNEEGTE